MIHALITAPFPPEALPRLSSIEGVEVKYIPSPTDEDAAWADFILGGPSMHVLHQANRLKVLQLHYAGVDALMKRTDFPQGVTLCNATGAFGQSISEYVMTMVLALYKQMGLYRDNQNRHIWQDMGRQDSPVGKTLLILGAGNIGTSVAKLFRPFGCKLIGMRRVPRECPEEFDRIITLEELDEFLPLADIVVGALPSTPATRKLLNRQRLVLLKSSAILINVGRGDLVDCEALAELLKNGGIRGAALDVTDPEPLPQDHPLWGCKNAILTPHITGGSFGHLTATEDFIYDLCRDNLERFRDGRPLRNVVDFSTGYKKTE